MRTPHGGVVRLPDHENVNPAARWTFLQGAITGAVLVAVFVAWCWVTP